MVACMGSNVHVSVEMVTPAGRTRVVHVDAVDEYKAKGWKQARKTRSKPKPEPAPESDTEPKEEAD